MYWSEFYPDYCNRDDIKLFFDKEERIVYDPGLDPHHLYLTLGKMWGDDYLKEWLLRGLIDTGLIITNELIQELSYYYNEKTIMNLMRKCNERITTDTFLRFSDIATMMPPVN